MSTIRIADIRFSGIAAAPVLLIMLAAWPAPAAASQADNPPGGGYFAYADVVEATPRYDWHEVTEPVAECTEVRHDRGYRDYHDDDYRSSERNHRYDDHRYRYDRHDRTEGGVAAGIVGGLIGGLIGHQFGDGDGRKILTVAGAMLGASIARDHVRADSGRYPHHVSDTHIHDVRHCTESRRTRRVRGVNGYDVTYRYQGGVFHKWMETHPGEVVRVHVAVAPLAME